MNGLLRAVFDAVVAGALLVDCKARIVRANAAFGELSGYPTGALQDTLLQDALFAEDRQTALEACRQIFAAEIPQFESELRLQRRDGGVLWRRFLITPLAENGEAPQYALIQLLDAAKPETDDELQRWQNVFIHAGWGIVIGSADGKTLERVNPAFARMHGYAVDELVGGSILDTFAPECRADVPNQIRLAHQQGRHIFESLHIRKDGSTFPVLIDVTTVYGSNGEVKCRIVNVQDISERKAAQERLALKNFALDRVHESAFLFDTQARILYVNDEACRSLGYSREELLGARFDKFDPDGRVDNLPEQLAALREARTLTFETRHCAKDGHIFPVEVTVNYLEYGGQEYLLTLVRDISERKHTEEMLRENEQRYREIFEHVSDALYLLEVTEDGRYRNLAVNPAFEKSTGIPAVQLVGKFTEETVPPEVAEAVNTKYRKCVDARTRLEGLVELDLPTGRRYYQSTLIPVFDPVTERVHRIVGITRDVTDRKRAEEMLQRQVELEAQLARVAEVVPGVLFSFRLEPNGAMGLTYASPRLEEVAGVDFAPMQTLSNMYPEDMPHHLETIRESARALKHCQSQFRVSHPVKGEVWIESHAIPARQPDGSVLWHGFMYDITERKREEAKEAVHLQIFEQLAQGVPLDEVLKLVVQYVETARPGFIGSIMQVSADGLRLEAAMTPSLPETYSAALNGIEIREGNGSCGTAAWRGETVIAEDVSTHPFWGPYWPLAEQVGVRSCWSEPILDSAGKVVGAFGIYQRQPAVPTETDMGLVRRATHLAAIAIERRRVEEQLRLKEFVLDSASEAVYIMGSDFRFIYVNEEACRALGYTREELLGMTPVDIDPDVSSLEAMQAVQWRTASERRFTFETRHRRRDGSVFPVEITAVGEMFEGRQLEISLVRDISERKQAEVKLENERARLRGFFQALPDLAWIKDLEGRYLGCNPVFERFFGASEAEIVGKTDYDFVDPGQAAFFRRKDMEAIAADAPRTNEEWIVFANEDRRALLETIKVPLRDAQGRIVGVLGVGHDITERKQAEEAVRRLNAELAATLQAIPDVMIELDRDGRYLNLWAHDPALLVAPKEAVIGKTVLEVLGPEADAFAKTVMREADRQGYSRGHTLKLELSHGIHWFEYSAAIKQGATPEIYSYTMLARDVTERKLAEEALAAREREFRTLAENSPDNIMRYDLQGRVVYANPQIERSIGVRPQDLVGKRPFENHNQERLSGRLYAEALTRVLETGEPDEVEIQVSDPSGVLTTHLIRFAAERGADGAIAGVLAIGRNITERKRAEEALAAREREFRTLAENSPDNVFRYDADCRTIYINPAAQRSVDVTRQYLLGKTLIEAYPDRPEAAVYHRRLQEVVRTGESAEMEMSVPTPEGGLALHQVYIVAERDGTGNVIGVLGIGRDISALKETERQLLESREQLRTLTARRERAREQERKRIARELHDELGQLLTSLRMNVIMLPVIFGGAQPGFRERTQEIAGAIDRMIGVVRDVVSSLRPAVLEMGVVPALEWLAGEFSHHTGIPVTLHVEEERIELDEERAVAVFRIVQESLTNVVRHAAAARAEIAIQRKDESFVLEIRDNGKGFGRNAMRGRKSFGLVGIEERAHMLQGKFEVISPASEGTVVRVTFPVDPDKGGGR
jgi:PAS domain S-box-containing protein